MKNVIKKCLLIGVPTVTVASVAEAASSQLMNNNVKNTIETEENQNEQGLPTKVTLESVIVNRDITTPYSSTPKSNDILVSLKTLNLGLYTNEIEVSGNIAPGGTTIKAKSSSIHYLDSSVTITFSIEGKVSFTNTFEFLSNSNYSINNYWLFDVGTNNKAVVLQTFAANFGKPLLNTNQLTYDVINENADLRNGKIRFRPVDNTNYYTPYNSSDSTTYFDVQYSGVNQEEFIFDDNWSDPIINGKVITGYQNIPQQETTLIIPPYVEVIADDAFANLATTNPNITTVLFDKSTRLEIRENVFGTNSNIINVDATLPNIEYLAANAFSGTTWWNNGNVVKTVASTETKLGYRYVDTSAFGNKIANFYWVLGASNDWDQYASINRIGNTKGSYGVASHAFEKNKQAKNFDYFYGQNQCQYVCDYAFNEADYRVFASGGYENHSSFVSYLGKYAFYQNINLTCRDGNNNGGTQLVIESLYYLGDYALFNAKQWGRAGGNGGGTTSQWHQLRWSMPNRQCYIGDSALTSTALAFINFNRNDSFVPFLHSNAFKDWDNFKGLNAWKINKGGNPAPTRAVVNKIETNPKLKTMYQNCLSKKNVSAYDLIHQYWLALNDEVITNTSGLVLNPTQTGSLSISSTEDAISVDPKYQLSPTSGSFIKFGLSITGDAITNGIIKVTENAKNWTLSLGDNAAPGTYPLVIQDFYNNEHWNIRNINITINP